MIPSLLTANSKESASEKLDEKTTDVETPQLAARVNENRGRSIEQEAVSSLTSDRKTEIVVKTSQNDLSSNRENEALSNIAVSAKEPVLIALNLPINVDVLDIERNVPSIINAETQVDQFLDAASPQYESNVIQNKMLAGIEINAIEFSRDRFAMNSS